MSRRIKLNIKGVEGMKALLMKESQVGSVTTSLVVRFS